MSAPPSMKRPPPPRTVPSGVLGSNPSAPALPSVAPSNMGSPPALIPASGQAPLQQPQQQQQQPAHAGAYGASQPSQPPSQPANAFGVGASSLPVNPQMYAAAPGAQANGAYGTSYAQPPYGTAHSQPAPYGGQAPAAVPASKGPVLVGAAAAPPALPNVKRRPSPSSTPRSNDTATLGPSSSAQNYNNNNTGATLVGATTTSVVPSGAYGSAASNVPSPSSPMSLPTPKKILVPPPPQAGNINNNSNSTSQFTQSYAYAPPQNNSSNAYATSNSSPDRMAAPRALPSGVSGSGNNYLSNLVQQQVNNVIANNRAGSPPRQASPVPPRGGGGGETNNSRAMNTSPPRGQHPYDAAYYAGAAGAPGSSPIPLQSSLSLVASPRPLNQQWNSPSRAMQQDAVASVNRNMAVNPNGRTLRPPAQDALTTFAVSAAVDTVGLHRVKIHDAINASLHVVSTSQFPLSVVPDRYSRTATMTSTVPGCISIEVLVMINGAHGSGHMSKCDEVRIVNVDTAKTSVRRLLNLAHKAVNFVPVTRGVLQIAAKTLAARREHADPARGPIATPVPRLAHPGSISEMVTLCEDDMVSNLPLRDGDVLMWVEADPALAFRPEYQIDAAVYPGQDPALVGSPNRQILSATRLPRGQYPALVHGNNAAQLSYPDRTDIAAPLTGPNIDYRNMSPGRQLRKDPGNGTASALTRAAVGTTPTRTGVATPSWGGGYGGNAPVGQTSDFGAAAATPHSSLAAYATSSLRQSAADLGAAAAMNRSGSATAMFSHAGTAASPVRAAPMTSAAATAAPIALSTGEVVYARSDEERRLVEEIRAIRRDMENSRY